MKPEQMRELTRKELGDLSSTTQQELRAWFANKITQATVADQPLLNRIMREFGELMKPGIPVESDKESREI